MVVTGDVTQIDLPRDRPLGAACAWAGFWTASEDIAFVQLRPRRTSCATSSSSDIVEAYRVAEEETREEVIDVEARVGAGRRAAPTSTALVSRPCCGRARLGLQRATWG